MPSLWFVCPVFGRRELAQICLTQLRRTCAALEANGVDASAVVVGDCELLGFASDLGFATVRRDNQFLSRKFNDGIQFAMDNRYANAPDANGRVRGPAADYVVPIGSDDWVDWRLFLNLPDTRTLVSFPRMSFVSEDGMELTAVHLDYPGGSGVRIWPRHALKATGFRPADEDRTRGCDTSILVNVQRAYPNLEIESRESDPRQIVDWKTAGANVNPYDTVANRWRGSSMGDPFEALADIYPEHALKDMSAHYRCCLPSPEDAGTGRNNTLLDMELNLA